MGTREIRERDTWITNNDGDVIGVQVSGRADAPTYFVVAQTNTVSNASVSAIWIGTQAQYDAIATKDANTEYNIVAA